MKKEKKNQNHPQRFYKQFVKLIIEREERQHVLSYRIRSPGTNSTLEVSSFFFGTTIRNITDT